ncbi:MAG: hypothetical protein U1A78_41795 [Polyangia bacterium]
MKRQSPLHRSWFRRAVERPQVAAAPALALSLFAALAAGAPGLARAEPAAGPQCPSEAKQRAALKLKERDGGNWLLACQAEADGTLLLAALQRPDEEKPGPLALIVAVAAAGQGAQRAQLKLDAGQLGASDGPPTLQIRADKLGETRVVRVSCTTETGEDYYSASELVTLLARAPGGLQPLWTGPGGSSSRSMDLCYVTRTAHFALDRDGSLQRTIRSEYSINKANYDRQNPTLRDLVKQCRGAATSTKRFPLTVRLP